MGVGDSVRLDTAPAWVLGDRVRLDAALAWVLGDRVAERERERGIDAEIDR